MGRCVQHPDGLILFPLTSQASFDTLNLKKRKRRAVMTSIYDELKELPIPCRSLLNIIQKNGPVTFSSLMDALKIGRSKLQSMMSQLLKSRIICECGYSESTGGRRSSSPRSILSRMRAIGSIALNIVLR